jgi:single-strand DNA-binding protein
MNKVVLIGNLVKDPVLRTTTSGKSVATFTIAINDGWGENKRTYYPNIVVWGKSAESCGNYLVKGSKVGITGKLTTRSWEQDGTKHYATEVVADMYDGVDFLSPKGDQPVAQNGGLTDEEIPF